MKRLFSMLLALAIINMMFVACDKEDSILTAPELPPLSSMQPDFSDFSAGNAESKSATNDLNITEGTAYNFSYAWLNVAYFNLILTGALAVPVAAFACSFKYEPTFLGDATWEWSYTVDGFGGAYTARLTGTVKSEEVEWKMYLQRSGIASFPEFLWFEGTSDLDGKGGDWVLYYSYLYQEPVLSIDWQKTGDDVGDITYKNVRELDNERNENVYKDSYIHIGKTEENPYTFYNIHIYNVEHEDFIDVDIEWSPSTYEGRVRSEVWIDGTWQCWDSNGYDIDCTE